jgi:TonB family protein
MHEARRTAHTHRGGGSVHALVQSYVRSLARTERWSLATGIAVLTFAAPLLAQEVTPPSLIESPEVTLPEGAEPIAEDASVLLALTIDAEGNVSDASIVEGVREDVDALVLEAARTMRFAPATRDDQPVPARIRFRFRVTAPPALEETPPEETPPEETPPEETPPEETPPEETPPEALDPEPVEELGVTASVVREEEGAASRITLRGEELTTVPGTFGEPLRAVASFPGVARSPFGIGFFLVRGADFQNTGFLVDGFPVPLLYHLGAGPAILHNRLIEQMDFYSGNYPLRFGRFGGGLVSLDTSFPNVRTPLGEISIDAARASVFAAFPFDEQRGGVAVAVRRSYFELFLPFIVPGIELSYTDYQALAQYRVNDAVSLSAFFFGADDRLDQSGQIGDGGLLSEGSRSGASFDLQRLIVTMRVRLPGRAQLRLSGMIGRDASGFDTSQPGFGLLHFAFEAFFAGWRLETEVIQSRELRARIGIDVNTLSASILGTAPVPSGLGEMPRPLPTIPTSETSLNVIQAFAAAYYEQVVDLPPLELSAGLRVDFMRYGDVFEPVFDPRAVARIRVHPLLTIKAASGLFVQQPSPFTIFRVGGNPRVAPERSWQNSAGIEMTFPYGIEANLTGFYNRQWNIARGVDEIMPTEDGLRRNFFSDDGEGQAWGLEAMLRMRYEGFYGWLTYTFSRSERWSPGVSPQVFGFDQTHVLNLVVSYGFDGWRFGGRFQLATGRPISTITGSRYDADSGGYAAIRAPSLEERLDYSHQLDIRIDRDFDIGPIRGSVFLDVANVYFSELPEGRIYQYDYGASTTLRGLPIIPTIGIRGALQ